MFVRLFTGYIRFGFAASPSYQLKRLLKGFQIIISMLWAANRCTRRYRVIIVKCITYEKEAIRINIKMSEVGFSNASPRRFGNMAGIAVKCVQFYIMFSAPVAVVTARSIGNNGWPQSRHAFWRRQNSNTLHCSTRITSQSKFTNDFVFFLNKNTDFF